MVPEEWTCPLYDPIGATLGGREFREPKKKGTGIFRRINIYIVSSIGKNRASAFLAVTLLYRGRNPDGEFKKGESWNSSAAFE